MLDGTSEIRAFPTPLPSFQDWDGVPFISLFPWQQCLAFSGSSINVYGIEINDLKGHKTDATNAQVNLALFPTQSEL